MTAPRADRESGVNTFVLPDQGFGPLAAAPRNARSGRDSSTPPCDPAPIRNQGSPA